MTQDTKLARIEGKIDRPVAGAISIRRGGGMAITSMSEVMEVSKMMAIAQQAVPKHLREQPGLCFGVVMQAMAWEMDVFAVANKSFVVNDRLGYEAQLIHAVIEARAPLKGRLRCTYDGEDGDRTCTILGTFDGETEPHTYTTPKIKNIPIKNSPLWKWDVDQQLFYFASRAWARKWCPDVLLGVYTPDELQFAGAEARDVTQTWKSVDNPMGDEPKVVDVERKNGKRDPYPDAKAHLKTEGGPAEPVDKVENNPVGVVRYWNHPESGSLWESVKDEKLGDDGFVEELDLEQYEKLLAEKAGVDSAEEGREADVDQDTPQDAPEAPKERSKPVEATPEPKKAENAPARPQSAPTTTSAAYFQEAMATIANAIDSGKLNTWWRGDRQKRLKECSAGELEQLNALYQDKFVALAKE